MWNSDLFTNYRIEIHVAYHYNDTSVLMHCYTLYEMVNLKLSTIVFFERNTNQKMVFRVQCSMKNLDCTRSYKTFIGTGMFRN